MTTPPSKNEDEPILTPEDHVKWNVWKQACLEWAETDVFSKRLENAKYHIRRMDERCPDAYVGWSAGKDSTVMTHLVMVECEAASNAMSIKDDLDYPGELKYVEDLADEWGIEVDILTPRESLFEKLKSMNIHYKENLHSRNSAFSSNIFYRLISKYREKKQCPGVYLGLRADESYGREMNSGRGAIYKKKIGEVVCQPLRYFTDKDIYAYMFSKNIPFHPVYKCIRLVDHPTDIRKSWWVSGDSNEYFDWPQWLRAHWPSLWEKHKQIFPESR